DRPLLSPGIDFPSQRQDSIVEINVNPLRFPFRLSLQGVHDCSADEPGIGLFGQYRDAVYDPIHSLKVPYGSPSLVAMPDGGDSSVQGNPSARYGAPDLGMGEESVPIQGLPDRVGDFRVGFGLVFWNVNFDVVGHAHHPAHPSSRFKRSRLFG